MEASGAHEQHEVRRKKSRLRSWVVARLPAYSPGVSPGTVVRSVWAKSGADNCLGVAAQVAYFFVLAVFPFFIFLAALAGYLPITGFWRDFVAWVTRYFPHDSQVLILNTVLSLTQSRQRFLSMGFAGATWAAATGVVMLIRGLDTIYGVRESRGFWKIYGLAVVMLFVLSFFFLGSFAVFAAGDRLDLSLAARLSPRFPAEGIADVARVAVSLLLLNLGVSLMNYALPNGKRPWRWVSAGSIFVAAVFIPASAGFGFYVSHCNYYPRMYGALGAFVIFMVWTYLASLILLVGAELDSEMTRLPLRSE
ncbi:MAG TPA: YihY/virulence factor BrkB family protein [Terriglobia bacterium]|nr:YihY/virulence factor BrkB family protein [Terriglobia bacterium]